MVSRQFRAFRSALVSALCLSWLLPASCEAMRVLVIADLHYDQQAQSTDYGKDTGRALMTASLAKARELIDAQRPAFVLVLGDLPSHTFFLQDRQKNLKASLTALDQAFDDTKIPVYLVPGNNDSPGGNYHSYSDREGHSLLDLDPGWPARRSEVACATANDTAPCVANQDDMTKAGYYAAYPLGKARHLQLIVLNSIIFASRYYESDDGVSQTDAAQREMNWLAQQLAAAKKQHDAVIIALHIPPGLDAYNERPMWTTLRVDGQPVLNRFLELMDRYHENVRLILSGHTHMEEVRRLYNKDGKLIALDISAASISPIHDNNPSLKVVEFDRQYTLQDSASYYTWPNNPEWQTDPYTGKQQYDCGVDSLARCLSTLDQEELNARMKPYYFALGRGRSVDWKPIYAGTMVLSPLATTD